MYYTYYIYFCVLYNCIILEVSTEVRKAAPSQKRRLYLSDLQLVRSELNLVCITSMQLGTYGKISRVGGLIGEGAFSVMKKQFSAVHSFSSLIAG